MKKLQISPNICADDIIDIIGSKNKEIKEGKEIKDFKKSV